MSPLQSKFPANRCISRSWPRSVDIILSLSSIIMSALMGTRKGTSFRRHLKGAWGIQAHSKLPSLINSINVHESMICRWANSIVPVWISVKETRRGLLLYFHCRTQYRTLLWQGFFLEYKRHQLEIPQPLRFHTTSAAMTNPQWETALMHSPIKKRYM